MTVKSLMKRRRKAGIAEIAKDIRGLRHIFTLVPWRMRWRAIGLLAMASIAALLDIVAVLMMLPLMQILTTPGELPANVERYVVPVLGTDNRASVLLGVASLVTFAFILKNAAMIGIRWWSLGIANNAQAAAQAELLRRYLSAPYAAHRQRSKATILQAVSGAIPLALTRVMQGYITVLVYGLTVLGLFLALLFVAPLGSLAALVIFGGTALLISRFLKPRALRNAHRALEVDTEAWRVLNPAIEGFRESRLLRKEAYFADEYSGNRERGARLGQVQGILGELPKYLLEIVMVLGIFIVALVLFGTADEARAFGLLAMFAAASIRIIPSLNIVVATYNGIVVGRPSLGLVIGELEALEHDASTSRHANEQQVDIAPADIVVSELSYRYPDGDGDVLSDVTVTIPVGTTIALVGSSGAGKTTFADILAGLLAATAGSVVVDGRDVADYPRSWLRNVAMVSQKVYLWETTLKRLITFGEPDDEVDEVRLAAALRDAQLDAYIASLPKGLETMIGEAGARLSGGQAQRVGIARALYANPMVLILDEATSALDNETEHEISKTIDALRGKITVVVIAHRLSTVKNADEILFFSEGRLKSRGTMQQLRVKDAEFARLVELGSLA